MLPYFSDALLPAPERYASEKYRALSRWFNPYKRTRPELIEVRAMLLMPGLNYAHLEAIMQWDRNMRRVLTVLDQLDDEAAPLVRANAAALSLDDGRAMLQAMLDAVPDWSRSVPLWATRWLQAERARGRNATQIAAALATTPDRVKRWWSADLFDPLTGIARPPGSTWRGRPTAQNRLRRFAL